MRDLITPSVVELVQQWTTAWWSGGDAPLDLGRTYSAAEHAEREACLDRFLAQVIAQVKRPLANAAERATAQQQMLAAVARLGQEALNWTPEHVEVLLKRGLPQALVIFAQMARQFDADMPGSNIFQAGRNVATMNCLQLMLGLPCAVTPSVFAYSMLYPYTDNYLDDPAVPVATKRRFNIEFGRRLTGEMITPTNAQEKQIYDLVGLIEADIDRQAHPQVYASLLAIHEAQIKSVQLVANTAPYDIDVLGISLEKGGTSVLADGYLVAKTLLPDQAQFLFAFGAFLQFVDDLQDAEQDHRDGLMTIFSQPARTWKLDALADRAMRFGVEATRYLDAFPGNDISPLKELVQGSVRQLVIGAAVRNPHLFTREYLGHLEAHFPFRFSYLKKAQKRLERRGLSLGRLIDAMATPQNLAMAAQSPL